MADNNSDIDSKAIIIPTIEEFCLSPKMISKEYEYTNGEHIEVKDIRVMREMFMKQNINYLEILYTDYFILNDKYADMFTQLFVKNRDYISHYDRKKTLDSISGQLLHTLHQDPTDNKKLYNAHRLYFFLRDYFNDKPYAECMVPTGVTWTNLWQLKYGQSKLSKDNNAKLKAAEKLEISVNNLVEKYSDATSIYHDKAEKILNQGTIEIIKKSLGINESTIQAKSFLESLTTIELRAYYNIINETHGNGNISISELIKKTSVSRPVYNHVLDKLKQYNLAIVKNKGAYGTDIEIIDPELRAEAAAYKS